MSKLNGNVISIDAETNGLWGSTFAIAMVKFTDGVEVDRLVVRCPIEDTVNEWVKSNVLPQMIHMKETHTTYEAMLETVSLWWIKNKKEHDALWHMGSIVETYMFREMHRLEFISDWEAPYLPIELSTLLAEKGYDADSVDGYIKTKGLPVPNVIGGSHNPLYDSIAASTVYYDLIK